MHETSVDRTKIMETTTMEPILTSGNVLLDKSADAWVDAVCHAVRESVGESPQVRLMPYRYCLQRYIGVDFFAAEDPGRSFVMTMAIATIGKIDLEMPRKDGSTYLHLEPTVRDGLDAISLVSIMANRLKASKVYFSDD